MTADPDLARLCPGCFADKGAANPCPHCGFDEQAQRPAQALALRSVLNGQFLIGRVLGKPGGFGITYLGWDLQLQTPVAIKEYLPRDLAVRAPDGSSILPHTAEEDGLFRYGLEQFLAEARTLARMDHPNIVRVRHFFEANRSAYLVMDYYRGLSLAEHLERLEQRGGPGRISERNALTLMQPILDGLRAVHAKGFLHRDVKPQNIYLARTDSGGVRPILLDFGAARQAVGERSRSLSVVISPGYAPFEQYHRKGAQGPPTDIYGAAAVLYRMLTGETPPEATERMADDTLRPAAAFGISQAVSDAIGQGLAMSPVLRPQTAQAFQELLVVGMEATRGPAPAAPGLRPAPAVQEQPPSRQPHGITGGQGPRPAQRVPAGPRLAQPSLRWGLWFRSTLALLGFSLVAAIHLGMQPELSREAARPTAVSAEAAARIKANPAIIPEMVRIRAGSFLMGCQEGEKECQSDEKPAHWVQVPAFDLGKYEVTFAEWDACVADGGCTHKPDDEGWGRADRPVINVSWSDAQKYVAWLSRKTGQVWRLPSEAEWEYAARAGTGTLFGTGDRINTAQANYDSNYGYAHQLPPLEVLTVGHTQPVGHYPANIWRLHDMHGNVGEWTDDCWNESYDRGPTDGSAWRDGDCSKRAVRGGSWAGIPWDLRSANRDWRDSEDRSFSNGFRVARTLSS